MKRTYRIVEHVIVRRICDVEASTGAEAIKRAAATTRCLGNGLEACWVVDSEHVDRHAVLAPSPKAELKLWRAQEELCESWLTLLRTELNRLSAPRSRRAS
jgi:hypothetical protein